MTKIFLSIMIILIWNNMSRQAQVSVMSQFEDLSCSLNNPLWPLLKDKDQGKYKDKDKDKYFWHSKFEMQS